MKHFYILITLTLCISVQSFAQNQIGLIPQVNADFKIGDGWKVNSKIEGRQIFSQSAIPAGERESEFERLDVELIATKSLDPLHSLGGGYLIRRSDKSFTHRFIQQYSITQRLSASRISHRFRTDQTLEENEPVQLRLRYRLSWEKPLNGMESDPGEFYLKINNEYLGILKGADENLEIRGLTSLGYELSDKNRIETGIDFRGENLLDSNPSYKWFLNIGLYHSF